MALEVRYPHVFSAGRIGTMKVKNRIEFAPLMSAHADPESGKCTPELIEFVTSQAKTGAGIVTIGAAPIDFEKARSQYGSLSVCRDSDLPYLRRLVFEAHRFGAKLSVELTHASYSEKQSLLHVKGAIVPSVIPELHGGEHVRQLEKQEMREITDRWADCTRRCREAGFDMVMIDAAHGDLLSAFLSPALNRRSDEFGGSPENRRRFPLDVLRAIRAAAGNKMAVELKVSGDEHIEGGTPREERIAFLQEAQKYVDLVTVTCGMKSDALSASYIVPSYCHGRTLNADYAAAVRAELEIPVGVVGGIMSIAEAEDVLASGKADFVSMARALIADGALLKKAWNGEEEHTRPCLRCQSCISFVSQGLPLRCAVEPQTAPLLPAPKKKKVVVVGGGPAGMTAARTLAARGHEVVLFERESKLGGRLAEASKLWLKDGFREYLDWCVRETEVCGARIVTDTFVTPDIIEREAPDAVIVAVGAEEIRPPLAGAHRVMTVAEANLGLRETGGNVVICGGGLSGCECALQLAHDGKNVTIVDAKSEDELCLGTPIREQLFSMLDGYGVRRLYGAHVTSFTDGGVKMIHGGEEKLLPCDTAIASFGLRPLEGLIESLRMSAAESAVVGDAYRVGRIADANLSAFDAAAEI